MTTPSFTIAELVAGGYTELGPRQVALLVQQGRITGVRRVGQTPLIPLTEDNLAALKRRRKPKVSRKHNGT